MEDQLITIETAKLAKEKGFDEYAIENHYSLTTGECYSATVISLNSSIYNQDWGVNGNCPILAPTQSLLQRWLREKHEIIINISPYYKSQKDLTLVYFIAIWGAKSNQFSGELYNSISKKLIRAWPNYEEALEYALVVALNLIKS